MIIGANADYYRDIYTNKFISSASLASLFYIGNNDFKIYLEIEGNMVENNEPEWLFNSGLEVKAYENIWAEFTAGIQSNLLPNQSSLVTNFKLKYGI